MESGYATTKDNLDSVVSLWTDVSSVLNVTIKQSAMIVKDLAAQKKVIMWTDDCDTGLWKPIRAVFPNFGVSMSTELLSDAIVNLDREGWIAANYEKWDFIRLTRQDYTAILDAASNILSGNATRAPLGPVKLIQSQQACTPNASTTRTNNSRWPWGDHHTVALGHLEAAAQRYWTTFDPNDATTANTNSTVSEWLQNERKVSKTMADAIASMLRADGLPTGPRR